MSTSRREETINLAAGPSALPTDCLVEAAAGLLDFEESGFGLCELSHRSKNFEKLIHEATQNLKQLLNVPDTFVVLYLQGGGLTQFSMTALNLATWYLSFHHDAQVVPADYIVTGSWSAKALQEASLLGIQANKVTDSRTISETKSFGSVQDPSQWQWSTPEQDKPAYIYYCANETVNGVEIQPPVVPDHLKDVPIVADMSSNFLSRPIPWSEHNFGIVYAGAQKNLGPPGLTLAFVRKDLIVDPSTVAHLKQAPKMPSMMTYKNFADNNSLYNTPPMFSIYVSGLVLKRLVAQGGVKAMEETNIAKAKLVYDLIDNSNGFYISKVDPDVRSRMNVVFVLRDGAEAEKRFIEQADKKGIKQIKGHRSVGGIRTSLYNAISLDAVRTLVAFMQEFMQTS